MRPFIVATICALLIQSTASPAAFAAEQTERVDQWDSLKSLTAGQKIEVKLRTGKPVKGDFAQVDDAALRLRRDRKLLELPKHDIASVHIFVPRSKGWSIARSTLIGAGLGAGIGAGTGAIFSSQDDFLVAETVAVFAIGGAIIGSAARAIKGLFSGRKRVGQIVYKSQ